MMNSSKCLLLAALMSLLLLHLCSQSEASTFDCCLRYTVHMLRARNIKSFSRQFANEACDIDAVIFHTKRGLSVCADPKKKWVTHAMYVLSQNAKKMKI
ncbi:C-C motif chemokine 20 isoform X2 [Sturnira hondurensis]|uniref:C-C motif chemokine 20 isoform X2 n=1 Tax=Sturnira hondurensis TaxID=192404 RepID=UPI0018793E1C|nr:C-C motif chemokine 20 isoform X2 [Sturnira hondurensis]